MDRYLHVYYTVACAAVIIVAALGFVPNKKENMTNVESVHAALTEWAKDVNPEAKAALLLNAAELAVLHLHLASFRDSLERTHTGEEGFTVFASLCKKVEALLVQAGYGGDLRP